MPRVKEGVLTEKQKRFCREIIKGKENTKAYRDAGYACKEGQGTRSNAYNLKKQEKIQKELARLQSLAEEGAILKREQRQALLTEIATQEKNDMPDRLRAMDQLNRMGGDYTDTIRTTVNAKVEMSYADRIAAIKADMDEET